VILKHGGWSVVLFLFCPILPIALLCPYAVDFSTTSCYFPRSRCVWPSSNLEVPQVLMQSSRFHLRSILPFRAVLFPSVISFATCFAIPVVSLLLISRPPPIQAETTLGLHSRLKSSTTRARSCSPTGLYRTFGLLVYLH